LSIPQRYSDGCALRRNRAGAPIWNDFPDYRTQGASKEEMVENLKDLLEDIESGEVPYIRKVEELQVA
jgi:hypothetical protein